MNEKRTSVFSNGLIWFGAGVSLAEILTGTYFAPLGFGKAMAAILLGHLIGGLMMFAAGMIGAKERKSAMETVKMSFGERGSLLFAILNVLQLVGWTAIMIYDGALAADGILRTGIWVWAIIIGVLIVVWIFIGLTNLGKLNTVAMTALFILSLVLFKVIFFGSGSMAAIVDDGSLTFGAAVELAVAMPLSWLPLISDYTREAEKPFAATLVSVVVYSLVSIFMYMIGMGAAIFTGEYDIAQIMLKTGFGVVGLLIIVFSTVTTTFLDAYSAGVSSVSISSRIKEKWAAIVVTVIGTVAAIVYYQFPVSDRICFCSNDCRSGRRLLFIKKGRCRKIGISVAEPDRVADRFCYLSCADACGYTGWKYTAGYGDYGDSLCGCGKGCRDGQSKIEVLF